MNFEFVKCDANKDAKWKVTLFFLFLIQVLKHEVELMSKMAKTIDGFTQNQTRMAVIIDGLDACEQDRVLQMLDTVGVHMTLLRRCISGGRSCLIPDNKIMDRNDVCQHLSLEQTMLERLLFWASTPIGSRTSHIPTSPCCVSSPGN